jgi:hypothetical protein
MAAKYQMLRGTVLPFASCVERSVGDASSGLEVLRLTGMIPNRSFEYNRVLEEFLCARILWEPRIYTERESAFHRDEQLDMQERSDMRLAKAESKELSPGVLESPGIEAQ